MDLVKTLEELLRVLDKEEWAIAAKNLAAQRLPGFLYKDIVPCNKTLLLCN